APRLVTIGRTPLFIEAGQARENHDFTKFGRGTFLAKGLDKLAFDSDLRKVICPTGTWSHATKGSDADTRSHHRTIARGGDPYSYYAQNCAPHSSPLEAPMRHRRSHIEEQAADALRRARKLPVGPTRNDLRQLAMGLLWLHRNGME